MHGQHLALFLCYLFSGAYIVLDPYKLLRAGQCLICLNSTLDLLQKSCWRRLNPSPSRRRHGLYLELLLPLQLPCEASGMDFQRTPQGLHAT